MSTSHDASGAFDLSRIQSETFIRNIDFHPTIESTNDRGLYLCSLAEKGSLKAPILVLTAQQTRGRGRRTNTWWSSAGALTFSIVLSPQQDWLPTVRWPMVSLTTGLAVCEAIRLFVGDDVGVSLKWPNDVFLAERKVCGILVEAPSMTPPRLIVGIGINVNNSFVVAPSELRAKGIALCDVTHKLIQMDDVLVAVLQRVEANLNLLVSDHTQVQRSWSRYCLLTGKTVLLQTGNNRDCGICRGIDVDGALMLDGETGVKRFNSGTVIEFG